MKKKLYGKHIPFNRREGTLEIRIRDSEYAIIYEREVGTKDKKGLQKMLGELHDKGVSFGKLSKEGLQWW